MEKAAPQGPDALSPPRAVTSTSEPTSGKETPPASKVNGSDSASASTPGSAEKDKSERDRERFEKHKPKRKDRNHDRDRAGKDAARDADAEGSGGERKDDATGPHKPELDTTGSPAPGSDAGPQSPRTESTGTRTPTTRKHGRHHPWTLFVRLSNTPSENDLRDFFGEAKGGVRVSVQLQRLHLCRNTDTWVRTSCQITRVNFPASNNERERKIAYVDFSDEQTMNAGLEKHAEVPLSLFSFVSHANFLTVHSQKLNDDIPEVSRAERDSRDYGSYRGRGRGGRGGHRGGFASRNLHSAGFIRGGAPKTNGDA